MASKYEPIFLHNPLGTASFSLDLQECNNKLVTFQIGISGSFEFCHSDARLTFWSSLRCNLISSQHELRSSNNSQDFERLDRFVGSSVRDTLRHWITRRRLILSYPVQLCFQGKNYCLEEISLEVYCAIGWRSLSGFILETQPYIDNTLSDVSF